MPNRLPRMPKILNRFQISGINFAVPSKTQTAEELGKLLNCDEDWIIQNVGVTKRHVCEPGDDPAKLAARAAKPLVDTFGEPDLLIYASATIRQCIPDTSVFVAGELGLSGVPTFSVNATCLSFLVALQHAGALIEAGVHKKVMIVSAELPTLSRDFSHPESAALLGDGAAAAIIESTERNAGAICFRQRTWPEFANLAQIRGGGLLKHPTFPTTTVSDYQFEMNGEQLLRTAIPKLKMFLGNLFKDVGIEPEDLDLIVPHQASAAGMKLLERLGLPPDRTVNILSDYGNCVSASIPMALAKATQEGRLKAGDKVLILGTAAGLSVGAAIIQW